MSWLRPYGNPSTNRCGTCGDTMKSGLVPVNKDTSTSYRLRWCPTCLTGWKIPDNKTDYRMFKVNGKWRALPR